MRIAVDTGGTFTDCVFVRQGEPQILKVFSTPTDPSHAILDALRQIAPATPLEVRHGTTVGTNTLLERKGARVAFVTTAGFEDTIAIGRQARQHLYDWLATPAPPLVAAELRFGVTERTSAEGKVLHEPTDDELRDLGERVREAKPDAIAISLIFSFAEPANERRVTQTLAKLGVPLSVSHQILPEFREFERASTVVVNAYLAPRMGRYITGLSDALAAKFRSSRLQIMQSSGGIVSAEVAAREPVRTVLSGPAGGVVGAYNIARLAGFERLIAFDMGGTSTDVTLVDADGPRSTNESAISELPISVPMLDIHTVGAGGGSLARFDAAGALRVGPLSAGADPGPICYGRGTEPTVTDANLALGRLDPDFFLGGAIKLDVARTRQYMEAGRGALRNIEAFAAGIVRLAEATMERAIRVISVERGHDPREFTLVAFGGAGPLHACALAKALHIPRVLAPRLPGALSALGILMSDSVKDYSRTVMLPPEMSRLQRHLAELEQQGSGQMARERLCAVVQRSADLRYAGQGFEVNVPLGTRTTSAQMVARFHIAHRQRYGYADEKRSVEVVNVRVRLVAAAEPVRLPKHRMRKGNGRQAMVKVGRTLFDGKSLRTPLYQRSLLRSGDVFRGPAIVAEYSATTVVPPGCVARVDQYRNILIEVR